MNKTLKWKIISSILLLICLALILLAFYLYRKPALVIYEHQRPAIADRNGESLVISLRDPDNKDIQYRTSTSAPETAAALIGYASHAPGNHHGLSGIERFIDFHELDKKVITTLDYNILQMLDALISRISTDVPDLKYVHATLLSSEGEMIATAQRPVMGIKKKRHGSPESTVFLPSTYLVPISEQMMTLLGCPPDATAQDKAKYQFHIKQGLEGEARGFVLGLNKKFPDAIETDPIQQAATPINYLLAYIAAREQKPINKLKLLSLEQLPQIKIVQPAIDWKLISLARNKASFNAIGEIRAWNSREGAATLYLFLRGACAEHDAQFTSDEQNKYDGCCKKAITILSTKTETMMKEKK